MHIRSASSAGLRLCIVLSLICSSLAHGGSSGSGFLVSKDGHIITCAHCVPEGAPVAVLSSDGLSRQASVVFCNRDFDIACVKIDGDFESILPLGDSAALQILDPVFIFGFPLPSALGRELSASEGRVNAIRGTGDSRLLQIDAVINPGNSGGPLLESSDSVVGMAVSKLDPSKSIRALGVLPERINFAVPSSLIIRELQRHGVPFQGVAPKTDGKKIAHQATVQILASERANSASFQGRNPELEKVKEAAAAYVLLGNSPDVEQELALFGEAVDYYDSGVINLDQIRKETLQLRKKWPERYYVVSGIDELSVSADQTFGSAVVHLRFALFNGEKSYRGEAHSLVIFNLTTESPTVVLVREHRSGKKRG